MMQPLGYHRLLTLAAALLILAGRLAAQTVELDARLVSAPLSPAATWSFGPVKPHLVDAVKRTGYAGVGGAAFMALGVALGRVNTCSGSAICTARRDVQTGMTWAFLGAVALGTAPQLKSGCNRSGRALLGLLGAAVGVSVASAVTDVPLMNASSLEPLTFRTMSSGLLGLSLGTATFTAIC